MSPPKTRPHLPTEKMAGNASLDFTHPQPPGLLEVSPETKDHGGHGPGIVVAMLVHHAEVEAVTTQRNGAASDGIAAEKDGAGDVLGAGLAPDLAPDHPQDPETGQIREACLQNVVIEGHSHHGKETPGEGKAGDLVVNFSTPTGEAIQIDHFQQGSLTLRVTAVSILQRYRWTGVSQKTHPG